jgi:hypothetical protein
MRASRHADERTCGTVCVLHDNQKHTPSVNVLRFLWYNGASLEPLWDVGRVTLADERWMRRVVGLNDSLIGRVKSWAAARDALGDLPRKDRLSAVDAEAGVLVIDLNAALHFHFRAQHVQTARPKAQH